MAIPTEYLSQLTESEFHCIFTAFLRSIKQASLKDGELCSHHLYECEFWNLHKVISYMRKMPDISAHLMKSFISRCPDVLRTQVQLQSESEILALCHSCLVYNHKKEECSEYISLALKLRLAACVTLIEEWPYFIPGMPDFLQYMARYRCRHAIFTSYVKVYFDIFPWIVEKDKQTEILTDILIVSYNLGVNILYLLENDYQSYLCRIISENRTSYIILAKYGFEGQKLFSLLENYFPIIHHDTDNLFGFKERRLPLSESRNMLRSCQILLFYVQAHYDKEEHRKDLSDEALRVLWNIVPDAFFTKTQFMSSFEHAGCCPEFLEVWKWYSTVVLEEVEYESSPRSLKHLSRCAIRRILKKSVKLPFGISLLDIPSELKSYLSLENILSVKPGKRTRLNAISS